MSWEKSLARDLVLSNGQTLKTLRDVAGLFVERFESFKDAPSVRRAIELLKEAAGSDSPHDVEAATDHIVTVLQDWRIMAVPDLVPDE
jgi:hypothetical protein